jgi:hypothetical protein
VIALTVRPPWSWAIAHGGKRIENRTWCPTWPWTLAIHAGVRVEPYYTLELVSELSGRPVAEVVAGCAEPYRGAVVAVAELVDVCTVRGGYGACDCGPWAMPHQYHWRLDDVQVLGQPVPARGQQKLWYPAEAAEAAVRAQLVAAAGAGEAL